MLFAAGVLLPVVLVLHVLVTDRNRVALTLDTGFLGAVIVAGCLAIGARVAALTEVWVATGRQTSLNRMEWMTAIAAVVALLAGAIVVVEVGRARAAIGPTFTPVADGPLFDADRVPNTTISRPSVPTVPTVPDVPTTTTTVAVDRVLRQPDIIMATTTTSTLPPKPARPDSGVSAAELVDVTTVLLLGGDAGPGRSGLRTDSMMLFSVHRPSGRASLVSVQRDLEHMLFPPGSAMEVEYPYGYTGIANAVYPTVSSRDHLRDDYDIEGVRPGVAALAQGIGYSLDVTIHDYVLVDMRGFLDLIDALGGVTVDVTKRIPMPGNVPGAPTQYPEAIGPGVIRMDGTTALGYARSRKGDSDYRRTARQRDLLASLAQQISLGDVVLSFGAVASAVGGTLRTSLTPDELADTLNVIGGETAIVESVGLVPPLVDPRRPDYDALAKVVGAVQIALVTGVPSGY